MNTSYKYTSNQFFFMPIDGRVGYDSSAKKFSRSGYGSSYQSGEKEKGIFNFADYGTGRSDFNPRTYPDTDAFKRYTLQYISTFRAEGGEKILEVSGSKFIFAPTDPVAAELTIVKSSSGQSTMPTPQNAPSGMQPPTPPSGQPPRTPQTGGSTPASGGQSTTAAGVQYLLNDGTSIVKGSGMLNWEILSDTILNQLPESIIADTEDPANALCGTGSINGIIMSNGAVGEAKLRTIIYAPTRELQKSNSTFEIRCFKDSGSIRYLDVIARNSYSQSGAAVQILNEGKDRVVDKYNLNGLKELVEDELLCIEGTSSSTAFYWNKEEIFKRLG